MPLKNFKQWVNPYGLGKHRQALQWTVFARGWYLFDCKGQDPYDSATVISSRLLGRHKPLFSMSSQDEGDHVVCINTRHLAMPEGEWRWRMYYHHSRYTRGRTWAPAYELHLNDPTMLLYKACYKLCGAMKDRLFKRRIVMTRLHLYPDGGETVPEEIMGNILDQIQQVQPVYKSITEYAEMELKKFPKVTDYPDDYVIRKPYE